MKFLSALMACFSMLFTFAQEPCTIQLSGHVVDEHSDKPLEFAQVYIIETSAGTMAGEKGGFAFNDLCPGQISIVVRHIGCQPDTYAFTLARDTHVHVALEHHRALLDIIEVEAEKPHEDVASMLTVDARTLSVSSGQDLASLVDDLEGVQMLSTSGNVAKPMIHGMHGNRLVLMNDFVKIEGQQWGVEHAPELDPLVAESFDVVHGASALRYGTEAIAGAIIAKPTRLDTMTKRSGWVHLAGATNGRKGTAAAKVYGALFKLSDIKFALQGSMTRGGDLKAPSYYLLNTGVSTYNYQGRVAFSRPKFYAEFKQSQFNTSLGILQYSHIGNLTDLNLILENGAPWNTSDTFSYNIRRPKQNVLHELTGFNMWYKPVETGKLSWNISRQYNLRQEFDNNIFASDQFAPNLHLEITTFISQLDWEQRINSKFKYELGITGQRQANTYEGRFFVPNFRANQLGGFAIGHLQLGDFETEAGIRYDFRGQEYFMPRDRETFRAERQFQGLAWNASALYAKPKWELMLNVGRAWRAPTANELFSAGLHHGASALEFGDESLEEERALSVTLRGDLKRVHWQGFQISGFASAHATYFDQFIYLIPQLERILTIRGAFPAFTYTNVSAFFRGVDFRIQVDRDRYQLRLSGEMLRASNTQTGQWLLFIPSDRFDASLGFYVDRRKQHQLRVSGLQVMEQTRLVRALDYADPPSAFFLLGAAYEGQMQLNNQPLVWSMGVENLLNREYRSYLNRLRYYAPELGRNFYLTIRIPFNF